MLIGLLSSILTAPANDSLTFVIDHKIQFCPVTHILFFLIKIKFLSVEGVVIVSFGKHKFSDLTISLAHFGKHYVSCNI